VAELPFRLEPALEVESLVSRREVLASAITAHACAPLGEEALRAVDAGLLHRVLCQVLALLGYLVASRRNDFGVVEGG